MYLLATFHKNDVEETSRTYYGHRRDKRGHNKQERAIIRAQALASLTLAAYGLVVRRKSILGMVILVLPVTNFGPLHRNYAYIFHSIEIM